MKEWENNERPIRVYRYPRCLQKPVGEAVRVCTRTHMGTGFAGTGPGWTSPTHAIPMCHPSYH